jgi:ATP synthase protein I
VVQGKAVASGFPRILPRFAATSVIVSSMTDRPIQNSGRHALWDDAEDGVARSSFKSLSREDAAVLRAQEPPVSPWRVIAVQAVVGVIAALVGWALTGKSAVAWSMLYGAATVVVPGALMARGMTSKLSSMAPGASAVSFMLWEFVKIGVSLAMLVVAGKIVQPLVWPALLVAMVVCMKVYWVALLWRRRKA